MDVFATRVCDRGIKMVMRAGPEEFNVGAIPGQETGSDGPLLRRSRQVFNVNYFCQRLASPESLLYESGCLN